MENTFVVRSNLVILTILPALDPILTPLPVLESKRKFPVISRVSEEPSSLFATVPKTQVISMTSEIVEIRSSQK